MKRYIISLFFLISNLAIANPALDVFHVSTGLLSPEGIQLNFKMTEGAYLYKKFIKIVSLDSNVQVGRLLFPEGEIKDTQLFGKVTVYHNNLSLNVPIENPAHQSLIHLKLSYQGCSEYGQCFPPTTLILNVDLNAQSASIKNSAGEILSTSPDQTPNETASIEQSLENSSFAWILGSFFILGLILSITPCILPMIPILSSIILYGYDRQQSSKIKAFSLSFAYVLGMSFAYAALGFLMSMIGSHVQAFFQNPYIIIGFSLLFVLLALSLLGFFELQWSSISNNKLSLLNQQLAQMACKNHLTIVGMGFLSALIVSPCITPPLVGALSYITATGNISIGTSALFCMGLGLGLPLLFIGALGNTFLPKVGRWMDTIKLLMGIVLLGIAFFMIQRLIPEYTTILWGFFVCTSFIILLYRVDFKTPWRQRLFQTLCFIGIVGGGLTFIHHVFNHSISQQKNYISVTNSEQLEYYLKLAKEEHKPVMVDFYADWCTDCQLMEAQIFNQPDVMSLLKKFMWLKVDMTKDSQKIWDLQEQYNVSGPPTFLFYAADGTPLKQFNFVGVKSQGSVVQILTNIL